jgi:tetratricopeptide (TPR) repeat protein
MYADATWLSGDGDTSLKLWQECAAEDAARAEALGKAIDAEIDNRTRLVKQDSTRRSEAELERCAQDYFKFLDDRKLPKDSGHVSNIQEALKLMKKPSDPEEHDRRMGAVVNKIVEGYKAAAAAMKKLNQVDAMNWLGLARAHRLLKQYPDSMKFYNQLSKGIDRVAFGDFYWDVQLELCQTAREGFGADKKQMGDLAQYVRLLKADDPGMGGKAGLFNQIEFDAKKASE